MGRVPRHFGKLVQPQNVPRLEVRSTMCSWQVGHWGVALDGGAGATTRWGSDSGSSGADCGGCVGTPLMSSTNASPPTQVMPLAPAKASASVVYVPQQTNSPRLTLSEAMTPNNSRMGATPICAVFQRLHWT